MDLARVQQKFSNTEILRWDSASATWVQTGAFGSLQVFDRFITERSFGQKKRILMVPEIHRLDPAINTVRLAGSGVTFLVEKFNEDIRYNESYGLTYLLHEAAFEVQVCKATTTPNAAGVKIISGETVSATVWADIERYSASASRQFEETEYTIVNITLPKGTVVDTDTYLKQPNGVRYNIDEVYTSLDLIGAKGKRVGVRA